MRVGKGGVRRDLYLRWGWSGVGSERCVKKTIN